MTNLSKKSPNKDLDNDSANDSANESANESANDLSNKRNSNLAILIWYLIFIITIPLLINHLGSFQSLRYYFPIVDLLANVSSYPKSEHLLNNLYKLTPDSLFSFFSTNFINLIALIGVSWNGIYYAIKTNNIWIGIMISVIMYTITYLLPTQGIGWAVVKFKKLLKNKDKEENIDKYKKVSSYLGGILFISFLIIIEFITIQFYLKTINLVD